MDRGRADKRHEERKKERRRVGKGNEKRGKLRRTSVRGIKDFFKKGEKKEEQERGGEIRERDGGEEEKQEEKDKQRGSKRERDALFESGLLWQHSVSMATIKISLHAHRHS